MGIPGQCGSVLFALLRGVGLGVERRRLILLFFQHFEMARAREETKVL